MHGIADESVRDRGGLPRATLEMIDSSLADASRPVLAVPVVAVNAGYDLAVFERECARRRVRRAARAPGSRLYVIDPYLLDRGVDRYRSGKRARTDVARHYGVEPGAARGARGEVETALRLVAAIVARYPRLAAMSLDDMQQFQAATVRARAAFPFRTVGRRGSLRPGPASRRVIPAAGMEVAG